MDFDLNEVSVCDVANGFFLPTFNFFFYINHQSSVRYLDDTFHGANIYLEIFLLLLNRRHLGIFTSRKREKKITGRADIFNMSK